ncbi:MAG: hypothetical protein WC574_00810 [Candidatus Omnitrophota bacterium]
MKFFIKLFFLFSACCLLSSGLSGCSTVSGSKNDNSGLLEPQALLKFADVPVPVGLKNLPKESYTFVSSGVRVGVLKYQGKSDPERIIAFYREQMAMYNWSLINIVEYGQRLMNFEKENETCIITIEPKGSASILTISLGPKSQKTTKSSKSPVK